MHYISSPEALVLALKHVNIAEIDKVHSIFSEMSVLKTGIIDILLENKCNIFAYISPP